MTTKVKWIIGLSVSALLLCLLLGFIIGRKQVKAKDRIIELLVNENQAYTTTLTRNKEYITTQDQLIITLKMAKEALLVDISDLKEKGIKDVSTIVKLNTEVKRLKIAGTYTIPVETIHDTVIVGSAEEGTWLKIPKDWSFKDKWLDIDGTVKATEVTINKLVSYGQPSITLGYSRGFLKKSKPIVVFEDKNPYTLVTDMSNVVIVNKPPFYKRPWFHMMEGAAIVVAGAWGVNQLK